MRSWIGRLALALGAALTIFGAGGATAQAAGPGRGAAPVAAVHVVAAGDAATAAPVQLPAADPRLQGAAAYFAGHPLRGSVTVVPAPATAPRGALSTWVNWWGIRIYLTNSDVRNIFFAVTIYGINAVADTLCAPAGLAAFACGLAGIVVGYIVAEAVWQAGLNRGGCGLYIDINWSLSWKAWGC